MKHIFTGKKILIGVTGSIAVFKICELVSELVKSGAAVKVVMTANATRFVSALTFESLSGNHVFTDMFGKTVESAYTHLDLASFPDVVLIAPATADIIGKMAHGIADDLLSTLFLGVECPVLLAPAMNCKMYRNPIVQENLERLGKKGVTLIPPEEGRLACGDVGPGRLAAVGDILEMLAFGLHTHKTLSGKTVLVTSGRTEEPIDPVRFITNRSSGKMGFAVAKAARRRGARVTVVSGPTRLKKPYGVDVVSVRTAGDMHNEVTRRIVNADILVMVAAVGDYSPVEYSEEKLVRGEDPLSLKLLPTQDILKSARKLTGPDTVMVGFALELENGLDRAWKKLEDKSLDVIVVNNQGVEGAGFEGDTNVATILTRKRKEIPLPLLTKDELADKIFDVIETL